MTNPNVGGTVTITNSNTQIGLALNNTYLGTMSLIYTDIDNDYENPLTNSTTMTVTIFIKSSCCSF